MTFFEYPYPIEANVDFEKTVRMPDLLALAAMKAFALGRRSKWKDYVDLYFLLKNYFEIDDIIQKAENIFSNEFSGKLFKAQLSFHSDINYSEEVEYLPGYETPQDEIKAFLIDKALEEI
jgi:hypothetical protein